MTDWRELVRYPETFDSREQACLDRTPFRLLQIVMGKEKAVSAEEKRVFVNCTKSVPSSDDERTLTKFRNQLKPLNTDAAQKQPEKKIDYDRLASGSGHGNKAARLQEQKKDRWGKDYS